MIKSLKKYNTDIEQVMCSNKYYILKTKPPRIIKYRSTAIQELLGAVLIVGIVFITPIFGIFGIIRFAGRRLTSLSEKYKIIYKRSKNGRTFRIHR